MQIGILGRGLSARGMGDLCFAPKDGILSITMDKNPVFWHGLWENNRDQQ